ncbi:MAG TPA: twin-arginine translocase subunit TatC [Solirubrobacter sp.]|nr:twin-arginine translocase subunit TatC [Solirubrobacter sp.]
MATVMRRVGHEDRLSLVEHLTELRVRIVVCLVAFAACTALCMTQNQTVLDVLTKPLTDTVAKGSRDPIMLGAGFDQQLAGVLREDASLYRALAAREDDGTVKTQLEQLAKDRERVAGLAPEVRSRRPVTLGVSEPFMQTLKVSMYAGLLLSLPVILFQLYAFVLPAFSPREKQVALPAMLMVPFLFIAGVVFGYFTVVPRAISFLQNFNTDSFDVLIQAQPYFKFVLMLLIAMGLLFQIPIGLVAVTRVGIVSTSQLAHNRRYAILVIAVLAMLLPGQDPITMTMMMAPMYVLFEGSILLSWLLDRRAGHAAVEEEESSPEPELVTSNQD